MGGAKSHQVRQFLRQISKVKTWQFILILIPCLFIWATLLRFDHVKMNDLRAEVLAADEAGDAAQLEEKMTELREFVFSHTVLTAVDDNGVQKLVLGSGPFYLENQYLRAANAAIEAAEAQAIDDRNPNGNIYAAATAVCKPQAIRNGWKWNSQGYLDCMTSELQKYPTYDYEAAMAVAVPSTELYRFNYASPIWAPTLAGFAAIICAILIVIIIIRFFLWCVIKIALIFLKKR